MGALAWHLHSTPESSPSERGPRGTRRTKVGWGAACWPVRLWGRAPSGYLPIWKQYCSNVRRPEDGLVSEYVNSTVRNMDLMDNLTSSQKNPDSSLGLYPALGFHCSPAQPGASSACGRGLQKWS